MSQALKGLVEDGQLGLAQKWAHTLPEAFKIGLVNHCVTVDRLKEAVKLVRHLKLQQVSLLSDVRHAPHLVIQSLHISLCKISAHDGVPVYALGSRFFQRCLQALNACTLSASCTTLHNDCCKQRVLRCRPFQTSTSCTSSAL